MHVTRAYRARARIRGNPTAGHLRVHRVDPAKEALMSLRLVLGIIFLAATAGCGSSNSTTPTNPSPPPTTTGSAVSIVVGATSLTTTAYAPNPITVSPGGTVTWTNNDSRAHTSTGNGGTWDSGSIAPGGSFSRTFASAGSFPYHCA